MNIFSSQVYDLSSQVNFEEKLADFVGNMLLIH
jgi:hypothetical protein